MAKVLVVTSGKGGVGKTTTAVNIACALALGGQRTLLVDLDPQGSASSPSAVSSALFHRAGGFRVRAIPPPAPVQLGIVCADPQLADEVRREVCDWLREHVTVTDRELARFMRG
jgi:hypothetical protein